MSTTSESDQLVVSLDPKVEQEPPTSNKQAGTLGSTAPTTGSTPAGKENSPNAMAPAAGIHTTTTPGSPVTESSSKLPSSDESMVPPSKKQKAADQGELLDLAVTLGYQPGDRLSVQWEIEQPDTADPIVKWWGATLQEFDGRSEDSVAIRVLKYDACPELGFEESSLEDVIFLGDSLLVSPDSTIQLNYKREGQDEDAIVWMNEDDMDQQLNAILMGALAKNEAMWKSLPPAKQALIAEQIKTKKEELLAVLRSKKEIITSSSIKDILRETFGGA